MVWTRQPSSPVPIDWKHPLATGLYIAFLPPFWGNLVTNRFGNFNAQPQFGATNSGRTFASPTGAANFLDISNTLPNSSLLGNADGGKGFSYLCIYRPFSYSGSLYPRLFGIAEYIGGSGTIFGFIEGGSGYLSVRAFSHAGGGIDNRIPAGVAAGKELLITDSFDTQANASRTLFVNDVDYSVADMGNAAWGAGDSVSASRAWVGIDDPTSDTDSEIALFLFWNNRRLTVAEHYTLQLNPWQIFLDTTDEDDLWSAQPTAIAPPNSITYNRMLLGM